MLPPLTTVRMSCSDIAHVALSMLHHRIEAGSGRRIIHPIETSLIVRQTTGAPSQGLLMKEPVRM
jgi:DNA-binding LacI/PurR family transcriptional regulator